MAGLLYKDWLLLRRQLWYYALLLGLYLALTCLLYTSPSPRD